MSALMAAATVVLLLLIAGSQTAPNQCLALSVQDVLAVPRVNAMYKGLPALRRRRVRHQIKELNIDFSVIDDLQIAPDGTLFIADWSLTMSHQHQHQQLLEDQSSTSNSNASSPRNRREAQINLDMFAFQDNG